MTVAQDNPAAAVASDTASPSPGLPDEGVGRLIREFRGLAHDYLALAALEARLSVDTVLRMVILAIVSAILLASAWLTLVGAAVLGLIRLGLAPALAMLLAAVASLLMALAGWRRIRYQAGTLGWPAMQRAIRPAPAPGAANEEVAT